MPEYPSTSPSQTGPATRSQPQTSDDTSTSTSRPSVIDYSTNSFDTPAPPPTLDPFAFNYQESDHPSRQTQVQVPTLHIRHPSITPKSPSSAGLHVETNFTHNSLRPILSNESTQGDLSASNQIVSPQSPSFSQSVAIPIRGGWQRSSLSAASMPSARSSPGSIVSSPMLAAMTDLTPLPSPLVESEMSYAWSKALHRRDGSAGSLSSIREEIKPENIPETASSKTSPSKGTKKKYGSLITQAVEANSANAYAAAHGRNRSLSEFTPEELHNPRPRNITMPIAGLDNASTSSLSGLHREPYLAEQRGLLPTTQSAQIHSLTATLPTPPASNASNASNRSTTDSECAETHIYQL